MEAARTPGGTPSRRTLLGLAAFGALAACTTSSQAPPTPATTTPTSGSTTGATTTTPATSSTTARPTATAVATTRVPVVLVVHPTRAAGLATTHAVLTAAAAGRPVTWEQLGGTGGTASTTRGAGSGGRTPDTAVVAAVQADRNRVGVVRADALGPGIAAVAVDGVDPVVTPSRYPLATTVPASNGLRPDRVVTTMWVGDVMLGRRVGTAIEAAGDVNLPFRDTAARLRAADLTVGNLECTMSRNGRPTQGGDSFGADPTTLVGLSDAGFDVLVLANNHLGDYGQTAMLETVSRVQGAGFATAGAGANLAAAIRPAVVTRSGVRFGVLAFNAIGETPAATTTTPGALSLGMRPRTGPLDEATLTRITNAVKAMRAVSDVVVVYPHWGTQYTHDAVPDQRTVARRLVDAGADAVIASHPHWVQGMELYEGTLVMHSLGNFVFDMTFSEQVQQGVALEVVFWGSRPMAARLLPFHISPQHVPAFLDPATGEGAEILSDVWRSSTGPFAMA